MIETVQQLFEKQFSSKPEFVVRAPGRVNLIGEHTDYNDGFVLPMAIDKAIWIALRPRDDDRVVLYSQDFPAPADFSLDQIVHVEGWGDYVHGIAWALQALNFPLSGWEGMLVSDIPIASGLSSSAALELAVSRAFWTLTRWDWDGSQIAKAAKKMENEWLNLKSGIMDQMISACGQAGHALLIDCRDLSTQSVPLPEDTSIVVMDTAVRRGLVSSAYNERVQQCQTAAAYFGVPSLREVSMEMLDSRSSGLDELIFRRARHVVSENLRTLKASTAMREGDGDAFGRLMSASHASLRDDYEVSCRELDIMVELALEQKGCLGARMTGGGFGGCAIALVQTLWAEPLIRQVTAAYTQAVQLKPDLFVCRASTGANMISGSS